jgi:hypothetical protein
MLTRTVSSIAALLCVSCASLDPCERATLREEPNPSQTLVATLTSAECSTYSGLQLVIGKPGEATGYGVSFFKILVQPPKATSRPPYSTAVDFSWVSDRDLVVNYPPWLRPAQRDQVAGAVRIEYRVQTSGGQGNQEDER